MYSRASRLQHVLMATRCYYMCCYVSRWYLGSSSGFHREAWGVSLSAGSGEARVSAASCCFEAALNAGALRSPPCSLPSGCTAPPGSADRLVPGLWSGGSGSALLSQPRAPHSQLGSDPPGAMQQQLASLWIRTPASVHHGSPLTGLGFGGRLRTVWSLQEPDHRNAKLPLR